MVRPKRQELQAVAASFKRSGYFGLHSNRVQRPNVDDLVVEPQSHGEHARYDRAQNANSSRRRFPAHEHRHVPR